MTCVNKSVTVFAQSAKNLFNRFLSSPFEGKMATFASREFNEKDEEDEVSTDAPGPSEKDVLGIVKTGPKKLTTGEVRKRKNWCFSN